MPSPLVAPASVGSLFSGEKTAMAIARLPNDSKKWGPFLHTQILRWVPYLAEHDIEIVLDHIDPEAGAALGYVQVRNRTRARPQDNASRAGNVLRIPIIVQDRKLEKFLVFEAGGQLYPLTEQRVEQAMLSPSPFDTDVRRVPRAASLVDQLYPPYQQRQGFGRVVEPGSAGLTKISSVIRERNAGGLYKSAMTRLDFSMGRAIPGQMVFPKLKGAPEFRPGSVIPSNYYFFPVMGTQMFMGVKREQAARLDKIKDQAGKRKVLMGLAWHELQTARAHTKSSGDLVLVKQEKKGFTYIRPTDGVGGR